MDINDSNLDLSHYPNAFTGNLLLFFILARELFFTCWQRDVVGILSFLLLLKLNGCLTFGDCLLDRINCWHLYSSCITELLQHSQLHFIVIQYLTMIFYFIFILLQIGFLKQLIGIPLFEFLTEHVLIRLVHFISDLFLEQLKSLNAFLAHIWLFCFHIFNCLSFSASFLVIFPNLLMNHLLNWLVFKHILILF